jgi:predicted AlkP superfamily phosphohydrolase/phosphomutase
MGLFDRLRGSGDPRVAFVGIDGVPYDLVAEHPDVFPTLSDVADSGSAGRIDSIVPPESSACWPSLTTGVNPGKTGVYGFQDREAGTYDTYVPMGRDVQADRVWDRVQAADREATVMNVPVTFPPQRNVQRMVSGFLAPEVEKAAHPASFADELADLDYRIDVNAKLGHEEDKSAFLEDAHETVDARYEAFSEVIERADWDLFFGVFMTTDRVNHFLFEEYVEDGEYAEEFFDFYRKVDRYLGELRDALPEDATMVVASDHGFTTQEYEVHCNEWLRREGWLSFADDDHDELGDVAGDTRAYSFIPGRFYLDLEGREPRGSVPAEEYEETRAELKAALESMEGPDGRKVADRVVEKEDVFAGDHDAIAPDLVVLPSDGFDLKAGFGGHDEVFGTGPRNGMHKFSNASLFVDDPDVRVDGEVDLYDVTPTLLDLMDVEFDRTEFDGRSLA